LRKNAENDPDFVQLKADKTMVTQGDTLSEDLIRAWIQERFPKDAIRGEERSEKKGGARQWIIDPIDGTYNFNHHASMFSISVGLIEDAVSRMGVLCYPAESIVINASEGEGAWMNGQRLAIAVPERELQNALIWRVSPELHGEYFFHSRFAKTLKQQARLRSPLVGMRGAQRSFTFAFLEFLRGEADAILHPGATPYDIGAICAIARELGLSFSGYDGEEIDFSKDTISIVISKNQKLHEQIIKTLNSGS